MIEVIQPGFLTSIQDHGRHGLRHIGVGTSGAMDTLALSIVNLMVGNSVDAAGIETTFGHFAIVFRGDSEVAVGGADAHAMLDGRPLPNWWCTGVRSGQILKLQAPRRGVRSYIAFRGGIAVPPVLGSRATDLKGGFGGHGGRALEEGDLLPIGTSALEPTDDPGFGLSPYRLNPYPELDAEVPTIHVLPAQHWEAFASAAQGSIADMAWVVSPESNRVGCRLSGPDVPFMANREMLSHGIVPGVVQVPPSGQPMVQLCDGNTIGGYPVVARVARADLHLFAQLRPGSRIRFEACDIVAAGDLWARRQRLLDAIEHRCRWGRMRILRRKGGKA